jgi:hypothetical protein
MKILKHWQPCILNELMYKAQCVIITRNFNPSWLFHQSPPLQTQQQENVQENVHVLYDGI